MALTVYDGHAEPLGEQQATVISQSRVLQDARDVSGVHLWRGSYVAGK